MSLVRRAHPSTPLSIISTIAALALAASACGDDVDALRAPRALRLSGSLTQHAAPAAPVVVRAAPPTTIERKDLVLGKGGVEAVCECYRADAHRDDVALYNTLDALSQRLATSTDVANPIDVGANLTDKSEVANQVIRLRDRLKENLPKLAVLFEKDCDEETARGAWDWIFNHEFWIKMVAKSAAHDTSVNRVHPLVLDVGVATHKEGAIRFKYRDKPLPKKMWLKFSIVSPPVAPPYMVRWLVKNAGDEAALANQLTHETDGPNMTTQWESTAFKGKHQMICEVRKDGLVVARGVKEIKVGER